MFEAAEVGHRIRKAEYEARVPQLRVDLVNAQYDLRQADFPVIIVIAGNDRAGCNDVLRKLHEVMDARFMQTNALGPSTEEELERPRFWRYWRRLPPRGRIGIFLGGLGGGADPGALRQHPRPRTGAAADRPHPALRGAPGQRRRPAPEILAAPAAKRAQEAPEKRQNGTRSAAGRSIPKTGRYTAATTRCCPFPSRWCGETSTGEAPWHIVESTDPGYRNLHIPRTIHGQPDASPHAAAARPGGAGQRPVRQHDHRGRPDDPGHGRSRQAAGEAPIPPAAAQIPGAAERP